MAAACGEFGCTERGRKTLIYRGFEYWRKRDNVNGTVAWRCSCYERFNCKATIVTQRERIVSERQPDHTHEGNVANAYARRAVGVMKEKVVETMATPSSSQAEVCSTLGDHVLMALPERSVLSRTLQRTRKKVHESPNGTPLLPPAPVDMQFDIPDMYKEMVLFDSGREENRLILMGSREVLDGLARATVWLADGTFKVVPLLYFQLYSIHFVFGNGFNPAALYCLLPNKTAETYGRVLDEVHNLIPSAAPTTILVDFERAAMNAFSAHYPGAAVSGCYFHLTQSVSRKVGEVGLKNLYENDDDVRDYVRCLSALAFVPPGDVLDVFEVLVATMPDTDHLDELTTFFEHTYLRGRRLPGGGLHYRPALFPIELWNKHASATDGIARTTNSVEGWHNGLQSIFHCQHPTMWKFMSGVQRDMQQQKTAFLHGVAGQLHPVTKRYRLLDERIRRAVNGYGRADALLYVRAMAHLSHA
jgi:hypothetical protein